MTTEGRAGGEESLTIDEIKYEWSLGLNYRVTKKNGTIRKKLKSHINFYKRKNSF